MLPRLEQGSLATVFGGSGFIGSQIVRALAGNRWRVRAAVRRPDLAGHLQPMGVVGQMNVTRRRIGSTVRGVTTQAGCSVLLLGASARPGKSVVAVYGASNHADRALELARQLASRRGSELVVLLDTSKRSAQTLEAAVRAQLEATATEARLETLGDGGFAALGPALQRHEGGMLVLASDCALIEGRQDELSSLEVPVLLARESTD